MSESSANDAEQLVVISLASLSVSGLLYGVFLVLFCASTYLMVRRQRSLYAHNAIQFGGPCPLRNPLMGAGLAFFITVTANWVLLVYRSFRAFVWFEQGTNPLDYYGLTNTSEVLKIGFWFASMAIGDAMIVYRLWVIWNYNTLIALLPSCTFIVSTVLAINMLSRFAADSSLIIIQTMIPEALWACIMSTNIYSCVLIAWRINRMALRPARSLNRHVASRAICIIIESATLFVGWGVAFLICYEVTDYAAFLIEDAWPPISGIAFMLINIRIGLGYTTGTVPDATPSRPTFACQSPILVSVTTVMEADTDVDYPVAAKPGTRSAHESMELEEIVFCSDASNQ